MKRAMILVFLLAACGKIPMLPGHGGDLVDLPDGEMSVEPPAPDPECIRHEADFDGMVLRATPTPIPFQGTRTIEIDTVKPSWWDDAVRHRIYLARIDWPYRWITAAVFSIPATGAILASWDGATWLTDPTIDIRPYMYVEPHRVVLPLRVTAAGIKPPPRIDLAADAVFWICEPLGAPTVDPMTVGDPATGLGDTPDAGDKGSFGNGTGGACVGGC